MGLTERSYRVDGEHSLVRMIVAILAMALLAATLSAGPAEGKIRSGKRSYARLVSEMSDRELETLKTFRESLAAVAADALKISLSNGDVVTCFPLEKQLSFVGISNPQIHMKPSSTPYESNPRSRVYAGIGKAQHVYQLNNVLCPLGTYPLRHFPSPSSTETPPAFSPNVTTQASIDAVQTPFYNHEHAFAATYGDFKGMGMSVNIWAPQVENTPNKDSFSLAQLWLVSSDSTLNTIEAGWQIYENLYGDSRPRLFVYWTADNYQSTGCYNLRCPGFVQVSNQVLVEGAYDRTSVVDGTQFELNMLVFQDPGTKSWWLQVNDEYVGYWPNSLFSNSLRSTGEAAEWGGEVFGSETTGKHYGTDMGSGAFPNAGFRRAAYVRNLQTVNVANELEDAEDVSLLTDTSQACYNAAGLDVMDFQTWGVSFFFGGPGYSDICQGATPT